MLQLRLNNFFTTKKPSERRRYPDQAVFTRFLKTTLSPRAKLMKIVTSLVEGNVSNSTIAIPGRDFCEASVELKRGLPRERSSDQFTLTKLLSLPSFRNLTIGGHFTRGSLAISKHKGKGRTLCV